jgi:triosephosphate isomerase
MVQGMTERQALVAANWKMNGNLASMKPLVDAIKSGLVDNNQVDVAICAPSLYLPELEQRLKGSGILVGAQNVSEHESGAFTGEISTSMLNDFDCHFIIVGHSERRSLYAESDDLVADKFAQVQSAAMVPILCVGELLSEREAGLTEEVVARQLDALLNKSGIAAFSQAVIAYEPVWAIGTGKTASKEQAQEVHEFISMTDVDGGLIGGASLKANDFLAICQAAR